MYRKLLTVFVSLLISLTSVAETIVTTGTEISRKTEEVKALMREFKKPTIKRNNDRLKPNMSIIGSGEQLDKTNYNALLGFDDKRQLVNIANAGEAYLRYMMRVLEKSVITDMALYESGNYSQLSNHMHAVTLNNIRFIRMRIKQMMKSKASDHYMNELDELYRHFYPQMELENEVASHHNVADYRHYKDYRKKNPRITFGRVMMVCQKCHNSYKLD